MFSGSDLNRRWESLRNDSQRLPGKLRLAARRLREEGAVPDWNFIDELTFYSQRFRDLREAVDCPNEEVTLEELNERIEFVVRCEQAEQILNRADRLSGEIPDRVSALIAEAKHAISRRDETAITSLIEGSHSLVPLVQLCDPECHLDDEAWERARLRVVHDFGNAAATSVIRGRIFIDT